MKPPADTSPEAWKVFLEIQRKMPAGEKIRRALEWSRTLRKLAEAGLRQQYPKADDREIFFRRARLELGADLFRRVYGAPCPRSHPPVNALRTTVD